MRPDASIVHVDLDAFFASVEQRDKPSLRGKPVVVGGVGRRGVVSTASYEARAFGARSAMSTAEARALCPAGTAFLWPRFEAYRKSSLCVMELLREVTPLVEQVSIDEAYLDLRGADLPDLEVTTVEKTLTELTASVREKTGGLTASAGAASSKMLAKIGSDFNKPAGITLIEPGRELESLAPLSVRVIGGIGPATAARLRTFGVETVADLRRMDRLDLTSVFGERHGNSLYALARAQDNRELTLEREAKSISAEETFERDVHERVILRREAERIAQSVARRMDESGVFGRTVHLKVRLPDFTAVTRSSTPSAPLHSWRDIARVAIKLLDGLDIPSGVRLIGVGVSGFVQHTQEGLFDLDERAEVAYPEVTGSGSTAMTGIAETEANPTHHDLSTRFSPSPAQLWRPGMDVEHSEFGPGWVWGSGLGRVTARFEGPKTAPGPIKTFAVDDENLKPGEAPSW